MVKQRIIETNEGIQGKATVQMYSSFQKNMRDKGWIETDNIIKAGNSRGHALEIGPGPGYLGLEWLKKTSQTQLTVLEISQAMIDISRQNAQDYHLDSDRITYVHHTAQVLPFEDNTFDSVFSAGSLHEWENPLEVFNEIHRVLKPSGKLFVSDLKRNINVLVKGMMKLTGKPKEIKAGLISSINAAYTIEELQTLLEQSAFTTYNISTNPFGIELSGEK